MAPGFMKGMKRMLGGGGSSSKTDKKKATEGALQTAASDGRLASKSLRSQSQPPPLGTRCQDQESFPLPQHNYSPSCSPKEALERSWPLPSKQTLLPRSQSAELDSNPSPEPVQSDATAAPPPRMSQLVSAPAIVDRRAKTAAMRHRAARHSSMQESGHSSRREGHSSKTSAQRGSASSRSGRQASQKETRGFTIDDLEIPDQEHEVGPPPNNQSRVDPVKGKPQRSSNRQSRAGRSSRRDFEGHLLTELEGFVDPAVRPVYHHSPVRQTVSQGHPQLRQAAELKHSTEAVSSRQPEAYLPDPGSRFPEEHAWQPAPDARRRESHQTELRDSAKDYQTLSSTSAGRRRGLSSAEQIHRRGDMPAASRNPGQPRKLHTAGGMSEPHTPGAVTPEAERDNRAVLETDSWHSLTSRSSRTPMGSSKSLSTQKSLPTPSLPPEPRWHASKVATQPASNFPDVPGPDTRWADLMEDSLQHEQRQGRRVISEVPRSHQTPEKHHRTFDSNGTKHRSAQPAAQYSPGDRLPLQTESRYRDPRFGVDYPEQPRQEHDKSQCNPQAARYEDAFTSLAALEHAFSQEARRVSEQAAGPSCSSSSHPQRLTGPERWLLNWPKDTESIGRHSAPGTNPLRAAKMRETYSQTQDCYSRYSEPLAGSPERRAALQRRLYTSGPESFRDGHLNRGHRRHQETDSYRQNSPSLADQASNRASHKNADRSYPKCKVADECWASHEGAYEQQGRIGSGLQRTSSAAAQDLTASRRAEHQSPGNHSSASARLRAMDDAARAAAALKDVQELRAYQQRLTASTGPSPVLASQSQGRDRQCITQQGGPTQQGLLMPYTASEEGRSRKDSKYRLDPLSIAEDKVYSPSTEEVIPRHLDFGPPGFTPQKQVQAAMVAAERQIEALRARLNAAGTHSNSQDLSTPRSLDNSNHANVEELSELRRVVAFLQSKLAGLEHELHTTREQQIDFKAEPAKLKQKLEAAEGVNSELMRVVDELRGALKSTIAEKGAELEQARSDLQAAQNEVVAQEELADLAKGELDEYKRRMAAEVEHARQEALKLARSQNGDNGKLHGELDRVMLQASRAVQERDSLCETLAASGRKRVELEQQNHDLKTELEIQKEKLTSMEEKVVQLEEEKMRLEIAREEAEGRAEELVAVQDRVATLEAEKARLEAALQEAKQAATQAKAGEEDAATVLQNPRAAPSLKYTELIDNSVLDTLDLEGDLEGFELGSFDLNVTKLEESPGKTAELEGGVISVTGAAREAIEEKAELLAEISELRSKLGAAIEESGRLKQVEALAEDALKALEAQTREGIRLQAHTTELEEALQCKDCHLQEAVQRQAVLEEAIADRDSQMTVKTGPIEVGLTSLSDIPSTYMDAKIEAGECIGTRTENEIKWFQSQVFEKSGRSFWPPGAMADLHKNSVRACLCLKPVEACQPVCFADTQHSEEA